MMGRPVDQINVCYDRKTTYKSEDWCFKYVCSNAGSPSLRAYPGFPRPHILGMGGSQGQRSYQNGPV